MEIDGQKLRDAFTWNMNGPSTALAGVHPALSAWRRGVPSSPRGSAEEARAEGTDWRPHSRPAVPPAPRPRLRCREADDPGDVLRDSL